MKIKRRGALNQVVITTCLDSVVQLREEAKVTFNLKSTTGILTNEPVRSRQGAKAKKKGVLAEGGE